MKKIISIFLVALMLMAGGATCLSAVPDDSAKSCLLMTLDGEIIYAHDENVRRGMASTTKIMTALVALENCPAERLVSVAPAAVNVEGSSVYLYAGEKITMENLLFALILAVMIIPAQTVMLPQFSIIYKMGLSNSYLALILPAIASPMYIFLFRQNFMGIPESIEEAAKLDGASAIRTFFQLVVPLAKPVYATVGILVFIACWNDFVWPVMVISDSSKQTIQMALSSLFSIQPVNYGNVMAGLTLVTIPVLIIFLSLQKYYVAGIASTGAKN